MTRVLVIDDNEDFRNLAKHWLQEAGFAVAVAPDGRIGLELQRYQPAEVIVTDIFMPDHDGIETISALRKEFPDVKIIAMTGHEALTSYDVLGVAQEIGAVKTFRKPFDLDDLVAAVRSLTGK
jgi:DNA-binding response OmpR family regulator